MSGDNPNSSWARQTVWRVHQSVLIDTPITPPWGSQAWAAVVWPDYRAPGGWGRSVMAPGPSGRGYAADRLTPGDVVEFGADYRRQMGRKRFEMVPYRWYGVVVATAQTHVAAVGPFPGPEPARQWAERALHTWRQAILADTPGLAELASPAPALPAARPARGPSVVEVHSDADVTRVDDPTHGRLVVDTALFGAAMSVDSAELASGLRHFHVDHGHPRLTGAESKATLAALTVHHLPNYVRDVLMVDAEVVDAEVVDAEVVDAEVVTAPIPVVPAGGKAPVYYGHPDGSVERVDHSGARALRPSMRWTPDGFSWGHLGDGPTELAYALLADSTGSKDLAGRLAGRYAADVVADLPQGQAWSRPVATVTAWAAQTQQRQPIPATSRPRQTRDRDVGAGL